MVEVEFAGHKCLAQFHRYRDTGQVAIRLVDRLDGAPVANATVNLPGVTLEPDEVLVKDWSENTGMLEALRTAGVVGDVRGWVHSGFVAAPVCRLLLTPPM